MKRKIIAISGKSNTGKTTMLKSLIKNLEGSGAKVLEKKERETADTWEILKYKDLHIGITTRGDNKASLKRDFEVLDNKNIKINVYICASRTKGETKDFIEEKAAEKKADIFFIGKAYVERFDGKTIKEARKKIDDICVRYIVEELLNKMTK